MKPNDVMPFGDRRFLLQFLEDIPDQIEFGRYYQATCQITLPDGAVAQQDCIVHWPTSRRNVVGQSLSNWLLIPIVTDLAGDQLFKSEISIIGYGAEISKELARAWWGVPSCSGGRSSM